MQIELPLEVFHLLAEEAMYIRRGKKFGSDNDLKHARAVRHEINNMYSITSDIKIVNK